MNNQSIISLFERDNRDPSCLEINYDFSGISGLFVPNTLFPNNEQFGSIGLNYFINEEYFPGIFISCYNQQNYTGSGIFQGENNLKVTNNLTGDSFTLFYNFGNISCNKDFTINAQTYNIPSGYIQVLSYIESKNNSSPFQIILGINDANKITLDFSGRNNNNIEVYKSINPAEIAGQNIVTLSFNKNLIEYTYFDIIEDEINTKSIILDNNYFKQSKNIFVGNLPTGRQRSNYTGYFGLIDDFIAYNEYIDLLFSNRLSQLFIKTGESTGYTNVSSFTYDVIQSGYLNPTGIIGTGITGYQMIPSSDIINSSCGDNCLVYVRSGITGILTGEKIEYLVLDQEKIYTNQQEIIYNLYDEHYASRFAKNHIIFTPRLDSKDIYNINYYRDVTNRVEVPNYSLLDNIYITTDNLNTKSKLIFFNGISIPTGDTNIDGRYFTSGNTKFVITTYEKDVKDLVIYSISDYSGSKYTNINYTGQPIEFDYPQDKANLFLNGQKIINNINYNTTGLHSLRNALNNFEIKSLVPYVVSFNNVKQIDGAGGGASDFRVIGIIDSGKLISTNIGFYGEGNVPSSLTGVKQIACGGYHDLALFNNGTVSGWGRNTNYQTTGQNGVALTLTGVKKIAAGGSFSIALLNDNTITGWGLNANNQLDIPKNINDYIDIDAGGSTSWGLRPNGSVTGWGYSANNLLTAGRHLTGIKQISAGADNILVLLNNNTITGWGLNQYYQTTGRNGAALTLTGVKKVITNIGSYASLAILDDNTITGWGAYLDGSPLIISTSLKNVRDAICGGYDINAFVATSGFNISSDLATGNLYIYTDNFITGITGSDIKYVSSSGVNYNNERVWLNGVYQNKNENYILTSCSNSLLLTQNEIYSKTEPLFTGDYYRFFQV
jgi:hypothetical protein